MPWHLINVACVAPPVVIVVFFAGKKKIIALHIRRRQRARMRAINCNRIVSRRTCRVLSTGDSCARRRRAHHCDSRAAHGCRPCARHVQQAVVGGRPNRGGRSVHSETRCGARGQPTAAVPTIRVAGRRRILLHGPRPKRDGDGQRIAGNRSGTSGNGPGITGNGTRTAGNRCRTRFRLAARVRFTFHDAEPLPPGVRTRYLRGERCNQHLHRRGC